MKQIYLATILVLAALSLSCPAFGDTLDSIYKGNFTNKELQINLRIDLYDEKIEIPGLDFLGKTHGYMSGNIYGIWMVTSCTTSKEKATIRISNDQGSDTQTVRLTPTADGKLLYEVVGNNEVKRIEGRKLVKIPSTLIFERE